MQQRSAMEMGCATKAQESACASTNSRAPLVINARRVFMVPNAINVSKYISFSYIIVLICFTFRVRGEHNMQWKW